MKEDKAYLIRKTMIVITLILMFATAGIVLMSSQIKTVSLDYYGSVKPVKTVASTVGSFLIQNKIYVIDGTEVSPSLDTKITSGLEIKVSSNKSFSKIDTDSLLVGYSPTVAKIIEVVDTVPYTEQVVETALLNRGTLSISQEGTNGQKTTRYLVKYSKEEEIFRAELDSAITTAPVDKVIEIGTKLVTPSVARCAAIQSPSTIYVDSGFKQYNIALPLEQQKFAYNMCQYYGIQYELFLALMYKESGYNPNAFGGGNSFGLCQIHISNHYKLMNILGVTDFFNPYDNIQSGAYMLSLYMNSAKNVVSGDYAITVYGLNSYNMGEGNYYSICYSQGILDRSYSSSILQLRDRLIANGGL